MEPNDVSEIMKRIFVSFLDSNIVKTVLPTCGQFVNYFISEWTKITFHFLCQKWNEFSYFPRLLRYNRENCRKFSAMRQQSSQTFVVIHRNEPGALMCEDRFGLSDYQSKCLNENSQVPVLFLTVSFDIAKSYWKFISRKCIESLVCKW